MFDTSTYSRKLLIRVQITRFYYSMLPIRLDHLEVIWGEGGLWSTSNTMIISVGSCLWLNLLFYILKIIILSTQKCSSFLNCFKVDDCKFINFFFIKKKKWNVHLSLVVILTDITIAINRSHCMAVFLLCQTYFFQFLHYSSIRVLCIIRSNLRIRSSQDHCKIMNYPEFN